MAAKSGYRLSSLAEADLEDIWFYTMETWSWEQARRYHDEILAAFDRLADGRAKGRPSDVRDGYLKYPVGSHLIFFRDGEEGLEIIRILHQRMDVSRYL